MAPFAPFGLADCGMVFALSLVLEVLFLYGFRAHDRNAETQVDGCAAWWICVWGGEGLRRGGKDIDSHP
jgi:hypothetical protein